MMLSVFGNDNEKIQRCLQSSILFLIYIHQSYAKNYIPISSNLFSSKKVTAFLSHAQWALEIPLHFTYLGGIFQLPSLFEVAQRLM